MTDRTWRVASSVVVKRRVARLRGGYGHWWVELETGESVGWWPNPVPVGLRAVVLGTEGEVNAVSSPLLGGCALRDPYCGQQADFSFHPWVAAGVDDAEIARLVREFATAASGRWCWGWWWVPGPTEHCQTFQDRLLSHAGLVVPPEMAHTRGPGCPFLLPLRRPWWRLRRTLDRQVRRLDRWPTRHPLDIPLGFAARPSDEPIRS